MKFDGVSSRGDAEMSAPLGYGKIEYAYHLMAVEAGVQMTTCRLHHEGGRSHFMTKRFDRTSRGGKLHMQSLGAMAHYDYRQPASYSYEQAVRVMKRLGLSRADVEQQVLRAFFNAVGRNCDDHVKNIAFLMDRQGAWTLSPAFDVSYALNPAGEWTSRHQMSINGKREGFEPRGPAWLWPTAGGIKTPQANQMLDRVIASVRRWPEFAETAGVPDEQMGKIGRAQLVAL